MHHAILLISCPDQKGITASVTRFIYENGGNIVHADQHIDDQTNTFFMRIEWELEGFAVPRQAIAAQFTPIAETYRMRWNLYFTSDRPRVAIFVSKHLHCLYDLLYRYKAGQLPCQISLIVSNHLDAQPLSSDFNIPFQSFPITPQNKDLQEGEELNLLTQEGIDLVVLARYHQILTKRFIERYPNKVINIHHSFLPAFVGGKPYLQAFNKGVKLIGATSHYVTEALDEGPIIEQDTVRVSHRDAVSDIIRKGEDLERVVLSRALRWHLDRKVLCYGNKTVVFD